MPSRNAFSPFANDPFFSGYAEHRSNIRHSLDQEIPFPSLCHGGGGQRRRSHDIGGLVPRDYFSDVMSSMQNMFQSMNNGFQMNLNADGGNGHAYVQSSVYSVRNTGSGQPEVYEAHHSNRYGPGGLREERKALRDTRQQIEKMGVGRHIGERGLYQEKKRNTRTNDIEEYQDLIGLDEGQVEGYKREWEEKTRDWSQMKLGQGNQDQRRQLAGAARQMKALEEKPHRK